MTTTQPLTTEIPTLSAPECPRGHGPMVLRASLTPEQAWCGTWYDCAPAPAGECCMSSTLIPTPELLASYEGRS